MHRSRCDGWLAGAAWANDAIYTKEKVLSYECFDLTVAEGIAHIRFNRPQKANSMIPSF